MNYPLVPRGDLQQGLCSTRAASWLQSEPSPSSGIRCAVCPALETCRGPAWGEGPELLRRKRPLELKLPDAQFSSDKCVKSAKCRGREVVFGIQSFHLHYIITLLRE
ncbi:unnamed protein product [Caretta caretta]